MSRLRSIFAKWFGGAEEEREPSDVERLRVEFRDRYHSFKLLLSANNKALEVMAEMEEALHGERPFGMSFVRTACTTVSVNVFRMIRKMDRLAPGKYPGLLPQFQDIQRRVHAVLNPQPEPADSRWVIPLEALDRSARDAAGSKMATLGELRPHTPLRIPSGFVITAWACRQFFARNDLQTEIDRRIQATEFGDIEQLHGLSSGIQQMVIRAEVPDELAAAIREAWTRMEAAAGGPLRAALRSSAVGEDEADSSFAGQYRSELNVSGENLLQAFKEVLASQYSLQALAYRFQRGFRDEDVPMCVGCMAMVDARVGGVIYTRSPVDAVDDAILIHAAPGLPKTVVDGSEPCDLFAVSRHPPFPILRREIPVKERMFVCYPDEGVCRMELTGEGRDRPAIDDGKVRYLAERAAEIEAVFGTAQDIEWAESEDGTMYLLQCRPLTAAAADAAEPAAGPDPPAGFEKDLPEPLARGGITASPGAAAGRVHVVEQGVDLLRFPDGGVLVTRQALPRWAPVLSRAGAVVTGQGSFAGHLASVAREFSVPALFGLDGAAERLRPGDEVTVDASGKAVYPGRVEALIRARGRGPARGVMAGSPVHRLLQEASRLVVPLHLLDPDSPEFAPANCRSYHDITRFIHEKSVQEMFAFGREHHFSERSSKQLHYKVPMQWWILNLDDGFRREVPGKYVTLEDIDSIPMLALWRGFTAIPWEGPPPMDGKGLMSVMFQATTNQSLNVGVRSRYAERNYFMISRHFCSLSSRLGFHFSTLEALVGDRAMENYLSFQFKGGAADFHRRRERVRLVGGLLEEMGFRVEIKDDHLLARLEGYEEAFMCSRLEALGYLTLHTRQLDMIMTNPIQVNRYREKMRRDIQSFLGTS